MSKELPKWTGRGQRRGDQVGRCWCRWSWPNDRATAILLAFPEPNASAAQRPAEIDQQHHVDLADEPDQQPRAKLCRQKRHGRSGTAGSTLKETATLPDCAKLHLVPDRILRGLREPGQRTSRILPKAHSEMHSKEEEPKRRADCAEYQSPVVL